MLRDGLAGAMVAAMLAALLPGVSLSPNLQTLALWWGSFCVIAAGSLIIRALLVHQRFDSVLLAALIGLVLACLLALAAPTLPGVLPSHALAVAGALVTGLTLLRPGPAISHGHSAVGLLIFGISCAAAYFWAAPTSQAIDIARAASRFPAWADYFLHAGEIASFTDSPAFGRGLLSLVDTPPRFYHLATYALAGALSDMTGLSALDMAVSGWLGLSWLTMLLGVALLGTTLGGAAVGVLAIAFICAVPDAAHYGIRNSFFSFHWLLITAPGSGFGVGAAAAGLACIVWWARHRQPQLLALGLAMLCATLVIRAHIFVVALPAGLLLIAAALVSFKRLLAFALRGGIAAGLVLAPLLLLPCELCIVLGYDPQLQPYLAAVLPMSRGWGSTATVHLLDSRFGVAVGIVAVLAAAYGGFLAAYLASLPWVRDMTRLLPLMLVGCFIFVTIFAPVFRHGDVTDIKHRGFVLVYAALAVGCADAVVRMTAWLSQGRPTPPRVLLAAAAIASVIVPAYRASSWARPQMDWADQHYNKAVDSNLLGLAERIRELRQPGDVLAMAKPAPRELLAEDATIASSLAAVPVYVSRSGIHQLSGARLAATVADRLAWTEAFNALPTYVQAQAEARRVGIRWLLARSGETQWDPEGAEAFAKAGQWRLYRFD